MVRCSAVRQKIVCGEQQSIIARDPRESFIVGRDVASIGFVSTEFDACVRRRELRADLGSVIAGRVIDDEYANVDLLAEDALDALAEKAAIVVTRNYHIDSAHGVSCPVSTAETGAQRVRHLE